MEITEHEMTAPQKKSECTCIVTERGGEGWTEEEENAVIESNCIFLCIYFRAIFPFTPLSSLLLLLRYHFHLWLLLCVGLMQSPQR